MKALVMTWDANRVKIWPSAAGGRIGIQVLQRPAHDVRDNVAATFIGRRDATKLRDWLTTWIDSQSADAP